MENKMMRNSVSAIVIMAMLITAVMLPMFAGDNKVLAEESADNKIVFNNNEADLKLVDALGTSEKSNERSVSSIDGTIDIKADSLLANCGTSLPSSITYGKATYFTIKSDGWGKYCTSYMPASGEIAYIPWTMTLFDPNKKNRGTEDLYNISQAQQYFVKPDKLGSWKLEMKFVKLQFRTGATANTSSNWLVVAYEPKTIYLKSTGPQKRYTLTLNANKGKIKGKSIKKKKVTSYNYYGKLPVPKRSGYNFAGWFTKKKGGTFVNAKKVNIKTKKHTLYAHWVKKSKYATKAQYKAVKIGMTYTEVKRVFGKKGIYLGTTSGGKVYAWYMNKAKSKACGVLIINGVVADKVRV